MRVRPSWDAKFMKLAYEWSEMSKDQRTAIGAVLIKGKRALLEGYNGLPERVDDSKPDRQVRPKKYFFFEHAERNCYYMAARYGICTDGSIMYTQGIPCADCARAVIQGGTVEIVVHKQWHEIWIGRTGANWGESCEMAKEMLDEAGVKIRQFDGVIGVETLLDAQLIKV
jgi:dCMP deaminase